MYDAIVVGGGPAGLTAATWLARYRRRVLVLDSGDYRNQQVERTHGYYSRDPATPGELRDAAQASLSAYRHASLRQGRVESVRRDRGFVVTLADGAELRALRLVLATGVADAFPRVDGFAEHYGASVFHCPTCDGLDAEGRPVVALGWSEHVAGFALGLLDWATSVTIVTDGHRFRGDEQLRVALAEHGVRVVERAALRFVGRRGDLRGLVLEGGEELPCEIAFFSVAHQPRHELAVQLGCALSGDGCVAVDGEGHTSVEGVYAAGDLTPGVQLIQVAAAKGAVAGIHAALSLRGEPGSPASPEPGPDVDEVLAEAR